MGTSNRLPIRDMAHWQTQRKCYLVKCSDAGCENSYNYRICKEALDTPRAVMNWQRNSAHTRGAEYFKFLFRIQGISEVSLRLPRRIYPFIRRRRDIRESQLTYQRNPGTPPFPFSPTLPSSRPMIAQKPSNIVNAYNPKRRENCVDDGAKQQNRDDTPDLYNT